MRNSILRTFIVSFLVTFIVGFTLLSALTDTSSTSGMMMQASAVSFDVSKLTLIFEISLVVAILFTAYNAWENNSIATSYKEDIARLEKNEAPKNPDLLVLAKQLADLQAELQAVSADETATRATIIEEERKRFARELHDSVSQELFATTMILSAVSSNKSPESNQTQTDLALKILHEAQNEMRAMLLHLRPTELEGKSLVEGLRGLIEELAAKVSSKIDYRLDDVAASVTIEDNLFRMSQEILSNTLRHAKAEHINVRLFEEKRTIILKITDDGIGFEEDVQKSASYGLKNLQERALLLGGTCHIQTAPNAGTSVEVRIPKIE
ncbi:MAG: sensor histidine kinase [Streptococcaceae bacterium]|jgi:NarL family two-component system sensor histidine kinase LiaS|nr:sensor histidine kinase [Streptococcaceae bacterium]